MSQGPLESTANYEGGAFHESFEKGGKSSGTLQIDADVLRFFTEEEGQQLERVVFPLETVELGSGGASDRLVFFKSPKYPDWSLFTHDRRILKHDALKRLTHTSDQVRGISRKRWLARAFTLGVLGPVGGRRARPVVAEGSDDPLRGGQDSRFGRGENRRDCVRTAYPGRNLLDSKEMEASVQELVAPLLEAIGSERYEFQVHVLEDASVNAFALPGGVTVLHTGLILKAETPEEILGVMAHEIAHVTEQHSMRGLIQAAGTTLLLSAVFGDIGGLGGVLINNSGFLLRMSYSRELETEADAVGMDYLVKANIDPQGMVAFFERLREIEKEMQEEGGVDLSVPGMELLSTHPATDERIADLQKAIDHLVKTSYQKSEFDLAGFKELVRNEIE